MKHKQGETLFVLTIRALNDSFDSVTVCVLTSAYLKLRGRVEEELVSQEGRAGREHHLMSPEGLVVAGQDGDVTEMLAGPQQIHVLQGRIPVTR